MCKDIDAISEDIDELLLRKLELIEEKVCTSVQMETLLKDGHIELAKAKYIRGKENISILQIPNNEDTVISLFDLEIKTINKNDDTVSCFDISLKKSTDKINEPGNPLKWFGLLVPQSLKNSQKRFQKSIYLSVKIANIQMELISILSKLKTLYTEKNSLCYKDDIET